MSNKLNIAYLSWIEDLYKNPIIKSQVIEVLKGIKKCWKDKNLYLISFQSFLNIIWRKRKEFALIKKNLSQKDIHLIIVPVFTTPFTAWFFAKWFIIPFIFLQTFPALLFISIFKKIQVLHCRSYPITLAAITVKKFRRIKVIFDPRSPFPEECVTANCWSYNSLSYKIWKCLEKIYLRESDITISIANTYVKHFKNISPNSRFIIIPNNVDVMSFRLDKKFRNQVRLNYGIDHDEIVFCYCGTLGNHWNNPTIYAKFIIRLRNLDVKYCFLFITPNIKELKEAFKKYGIKPEEYIAISANLKDVPKYLSAADFGLNLMDRPDIRMSIKIVEYLAMGLPIIINSNVLGAREIIKQHDVGLVVEDLENMNLEEIENIIENVIQKKGQLSLQCRKVACEKFSTEKVAKQYIETYSNLLKINKECIISKN